METRFTEVNAKLDGIMLQLRDIRGDLFILSAQVRDLHDDVINNDILTVTATIDGVLSGLGTREILRQRAEKLFKGPWMRFSSRPSEA